MTDFSNYSKTTAEIVAGYLEDPGARATDEMFLEAAQRIAPPLLPATYMKMLAIELDPARQRRGRPRSGGQRSAQILLRLRKISRDDVPAGFLIALIKRLESGKAFRELQRSRGTFREFRKRNRDTMIRGLYRDFYAALAGEPVDSIEHPILGKVKVPTDLKSKSERARQMTAEMIAWFGWPWVSGPSIRNIVSAGYSFRKK